MTVREILIAQGGAARTKTLLKFGITHDQIFGACSRGEITRLRKGVYATDYWSPVSRAATHGGRVSCVSALRSRGVWLLRDDDMLHIDVGVNGARHEHRDCVCTVHNTDSRTSFGISPVRVALVQAAACLDAEEFFAAYESAWNLRLLSAADRQWIRRQLPSGKRQLVDMARGDAQSGLESILRLRLIRLGLTTQSQVWISGVGRVDFLVDRVIIEVDGRLGHEGGESRHKDLIRDVEAIRQGFRVVRLNYAMVIFDWPRAEAAILAALAQ